MSWVAKMNCPACGAENPSEQKFCNECAAPFKKRCAKCGYENAPTAKFCGECAGSLASSESRSIIRSISLPVSVALEQTLADSAELEGERKTVTALFADIKGSTELMADLDPEEARAIVDPALKLMIDAVHRYDGFVVQSTGDGIFALFGAPVAHEDHPQRALYAGLRMQEELRGYGAKLQAEGRAPVEIRVGVNTGEVVMRSITTGATQVEYTPIGHTTNLASRLQSIARTGSIVASETTRRLCEGYFILKPLGATKVKGVSEPVNVYEVTGLGPLRTRLQRSAGRGLTKFVGRDREMEALKQAAERATSGHGQIVAAMAEPGVGKSRLFFEFKATSQSGWMVLETFSISHGKASAYLPVIDLLRNYFDIAAGDDERKRREKVTGRVLALDRTLEDTLPYLFSLLGIVEGDDPLVQMDGQIRKRRTLEAIKRILLRESLNQPLMMIFEDLHWMDGESESLLKLLADAIATSKILLLVNYRPEYSHQWNSKTYYTQLRLDPLGRQSADEMLDTLLGTGPDLSALKRLIADKTQGNPFFIEEIVQGLFEERALLRNGDVHLTKPLGELKIPATVQAMLASRIDRLLPDDKELLQTLAVLGKEFSLSHLKATAAKSDSEIERMLADLQLAEFIYEQPSSGDVEYAFKHALTQEVTYNSILSERRKALHERAGQVMESLFAASLADHYDDLAHHYRRSGNAAEAIHYLRLAADQAMNRSAYGEAAGQFRAAVELLGTQPEGIERDRSEIALRVDLAVCLVFSVTAGFSNINTIDSLERARELCRRADDEASLLRVLGALAFLYGNRLERQRSLSVSEELLRISIRLQDSEMEGRARLWLGFSPLWAGNLRVAIEEFDQADKLPIRGTQFRREVTFGNWRTICRSFASVTLWLLGNPDRAIARSEESFVIAREIKDSPSDLVGALFWCTLLNLLRRDPMTARTLSDEATMMANENSIASILGNIAFWRGWALTQSGQTKEGLSEMLRWQPELKQNVLSEIFLFVALPQGYLAAGRAQDGLQAVNQGFEAIRKTGTSCFEAELGRVKGELLLMKDNEGEAEAALCFREAIQVAQRQSAKSWELRTTTSLARLLQRQGRRDEARTMLANIYNWFTEGFDTADLKDARAILDQLAT
jgi:class 3 adenylate cyclase/tetratricopeptide (TPR) repeat protein